MLVFTGVVIIIIGVLIVLVTKRLDVFRITRNVTIFVPAATQFEHVNDLHKWDAWSPWAKLDPAAKYSFEGPSAGTGAIMW